MKEKKSALLVGVGGQGAILTAKVLVNGLMKAGYDVKMSEVHGMSQRGGSVSTQVHWGEKVFSPVIGKGAADIIVAFEEMEAVRYADYLKPDGVAVINAYRMDSSTTAAGLAEYPQGCLEAMQKHFRCFVLTPSASPRSWATESAPTSFCSAAWSRRWAWTASPIGRPSWRRPSPKSSGR